MKAWLAKIVTFRFILIIYILLPLLSAVQSILLTVKSDEKYTHYNNYVIFKNSHFHLLENKDLYSWYLEEQWDLYKYSPTFSLFFGVFSYFPDSIGVFLWNLVNALILFYAIWKLPGIKENLKLGMLLFCALELMTSLQNEQSNGLMAGLMILAFVFLEERKYFLAMMVLFFSIHIKIFSVVFFILLLFYPQKWKLVLYALLSFLIYLFIPLLVVSPDQLSFLYKSWWGMLTHDHDVSIGYSVMGWLQVWFGLVVDKKWLLLPGVALLLIPFLKTNQYKDYSYRILSLASVLLWVVIFNHKAESPTFIIAIAGVAIWYFVQEPSKTNDILIVMAFVFTCLSPTDLFPKFIREEYFKPLLVKAVPCILIWFVLTYQVIANKFTRRIG